MLAIGGSLRRGSFNRMLLKLAAVSSPPSLEVEIYDELASIPLFDEDVEAAAQGGPPSVKRLRDEVKAADGLLIATPEYNQSMSGVLKNSIDWLSRPGPEEVLIGKPVAIVGASGGRWGTRLAQANLRQVLTATESLVMPQPAIFVAEASKVFDADGRLLNDVLRKQLQVFMRAFFEWLSRMKATSIAQA
ncbi:MAG TPA: NADPH-dependent FMN reductase [Gemmatimonadaceae bacterium]|nr:NADPH-dependent FMN reductase [Gemmatimonadaceae bacterium]